ncbi:MAG: hypothetical protein C5B55_12265 [Blastocatellia bacterium]|nr:MAG: hypothetical protein C5B55_12265 [Blastocatellia bacterium]
MSAPTQTSYDEVEYPSYAYAQTHPDRLATIATLLGMNPAPINACRVLELGCGAGGNIVPMAFGLPGSTFIGIDLAAAAIAQGQQFIQALGLKNVSLHQLDVMAVSEELGKFDYIIAHGIFSWVPQVVRDRMLAICRSHLNDHGVAYISFNAYPGCRLREIVRDIMLFHTRDVTDITERVEQGRGVIKWIAEAQKEKNSYARFLSETATRLADRSVGSIYHDEMSEINDPFYFHEFAKHASQHNLQFLSEADYFEGSVPNDLTDEVVAQVKQLNEQDPLAKEQYLDLLKGRSFRQSLLCHREVALARHPITDRVKNLFIRSRAESVSAQPDVRSDKPEEFRSTKGAAAVTDNPLAKAALVFLNKIYPQTVSFQDLMTNAVDLANLGSPDEQLSNMLASILTATYSVDLIELRVQEGVFAAIPSSFPLASPIARYQLQQANIVTTLFHNTLRLEGSLACELPRLLDGTRDRTALISEMTQIIKSNQTYDEARKNEFLRDLPQELEKRLAELANLGLLLG